MASGFMTTVVSRLFPGKGRGDRTARAHVGENGAQTLLSAHSPNPAPSNPKRRGRDHERSSKHQATAAVPAVKRREDKGKSPLLASLRKKTRPLSCFVARTQSPTGLRGTLYVDEELEHQQDSRRRGGKKDEGNKSGSQQRKEKKPRRPLSCIVQPPSPRMSPTMDRFPGVQENSGDAGSQTRGEDCPIYREAIPRPRPVSCYVGQPPQRSPPPYSRPRQPYIEVREEYVEQHVMEAVQQQASPPYKAVSHTPPPPPTQKASRGDATTEHIPSNPEFLSTSFSLSSEPQSYYETPAQDQIFSQTSDKEYPRDVDTSADQDQFLLPPRPDPPNPQLASFQKQSTPILGSPRPSRRCADPRCNLDPCPYSLPASWDGGRYYYKDSFPSAGSPGRQARPQSACFLCEPGPCSLAGRPVSQCYFPGCSLPVLGPAPAPAPVPASTGGQLYGATPRGLPDNVRVYQETEQFSEPKQASPREFPMSPGYMSARQDCPQMSRNAVVDPSSIPKSSPLSPRYGSPPQQSAESGLLSPTYGSPSQNCPEPSTLSPSGGSPPQESPQSPPKPPRHGSPAPVPAKRRAVPRPKSTCLQPTETESKTSLTAFPGPVPTARPRVTLKKYRSADCLDRVDELQSLEVSPPPARPLSYFMKYDDEKEKKNGEEIFTSAEMLEKLGHPVCGDGSESGPKSSSECESDSRPRSSSGSEARPRSLSGSQPRPRSSSGSGPGSRNQPRPFSCILASSSSADESGYLSTATLGGSCWLGGLSASTGDMLEAMDVEEMQVADDELSFERSNSLRKAWSLCSLLRHDTIQDRSFTVMRRRRQKMKDRRHTNQRSSSTETDDGVDVKAANSNSSLLEGEKDGESATIAGIPLDRKKRANESHGGHVTRLHSAHLKAWQIRLRRKQMMVRQRSADRLHSRMETLV